VSGIFLFDPFHRVAALQTPPWRRVDPSSILSSPKRRKISEDDDMGSEGVATAGNASASSVAETNAAAISQKTRDLVIPSTPPDDTPVDTNAFIERNATNLSVDEEIDAWWESAISEVVVLKTPLASPATPASGNTKKRFNLHV
jgi:hypothetical protein